MIRTHFRCVKSKNLLNYKEKSSILTEDEKTKGLGRLPPEPLPKRSLNRPVVGNNRIVWFSSSPQPHQITPFLPPILAVSLLFLKS